MVAGRAAQDAYRVRPWRSAGTRHGPSVLPRLVVSGVVGIVASIVVYSQFHHGRKEVNDGSTTEANEFRKHARSDSP